MLKLKSTDEYCYILFSAFNKFAEEPEDLDTIMLSVYKGGYYFDEIAGIYKTMYKVIDIPLPEAKHKYEPDQDDRITDEELNAEYEKMDEDLVEIEKQL